MAFIDSFDEGQDNDMLKCVKCDQPFNNVNSLAVHMKSHKVDLQVKTGDLFVCQKCGKTAKTRQALERHAAYHQEDRPFACEKCHQRFKNSDDRGKHYRRLKKDGKYLFSCTTCHKHFKSDVLLRKHQVMLGCLNAPSDVTDKPDTVNEGNEDTHDDKVPLAVPEAPLGLGVKPIPCRCKICEMDFKSPELLKAHYRLHHSELKRQVCIQCGQTLSSKDSLNRHYNIFHQEEFSYPCIQCDQKFKIKESMFRHVKFVHTDGGYPCPVCKHVFSQPVNLKKHMSVHSIEKKHVCMVCNKGFKLKQSLRKHLIVHTNKKFKYEEVYISDTEEEEMPEQFEIAHQLECLSQQKTFGNGYADENRTDEGRKNAELSTCVNHQKVCVTSNPRAVVDSRNVTFVERDEDIGKSDEQPVVPEPVHDSVLDISNHANENDETRFDIVHDDVEVSEAKTYDTMSDLSNADIKNDETCVEVIQNAHCMTSTSIDTSYNLENEPEISTVHCDNKKRNFYPKNRKEKEKIDQEKKKQIARPIDNGDPSDVGMSNEVMSENWRTNSEAMQSDFDTPEGPDAENRYGRVDLDSNVKPTDDPYSHPQVLPNSQENNLVRELSSSKEKCYENLDFEQTLDRFHGERCIDLVINLAEKHTDSEAQRLADLYQETESEGPTVVKKKQMEGTDEHLSKDLVKIPDKTEQSKPRLTFKPSHLPLIMAPTFVSNGQRSSIKDKTSTQFNVITASDEQRNYRQSSVMLNHGQRSVRNPFIIQNLCRRTTTDGFCQCQKCAPYDEEEATAMNLCVTDNGKQMSKTAACDVAPGKFSLIKHMLSLQNEENFDKSLFDNPLYNKPAQIHSFPKLAAMYKISDSSDMEQYDLSGKQNIPLHWLCLRRTSNITESVQINDGSGKIMHNSSKSKSFESNSLCDPDEPTFKLNKHGDRDTKSFVDTEKCGDNGVDISQNIMDIMERDSTHKSETIAQMNKAVRGAGINLQHNFISDSSHTLCSPTKNLMDDNWERSFSRNTLGGGFNSPTWNENQISQIEGCHAGNDNHKTSVENLSSGSETLTHGRSRQLSSLTHVGKGEGEMDRWHPYKAIKTLRAHGNMNRAGFDSTIDQPSVFLNPLEMSLMKPSRSSSLTEQPVIECSYNNQDLDKLFNQSNNVSTSSMCSSVQKNAQSEGFDSQHWVDSASSGSFSQSDILHLNESSLTVHNQPVFTSTPSSQSPKIQPIHRSSHGFSERGDRDELSAGSNDRHGISHGTFSSQNMVYTSPNTCSNLQMISSDTHVNETVFSVGNNSCVFQSSHDSHLLQSITRNSEANNQRQSNDFCVKRFDSTFSDQQRHHNVMSSKENDARLSSPKEFVGKLSLVAKSQTRHSQYTLAKMAINQDKGKGNGPPFPNCDPLNPINLIKQGNSPLRSISDINDMNFTKFKESTSSLEMMGDAGADLLPTKEITMPTRGLICDRKEGLSVDDLLLMPHGLGL